MIIKLEIAALNMGGTGFWILFLKFSPEEGFLDKWIFGVCLWEGLVV